MEQSKSVCTFCITSKLSPTELKSTMTTISDNFLSDNTLDNPINTAEDDDYLQQINLSAIESDFLLLNDIEMDNDFSNLFNIESEATMANNYEIMELSDSIDYFASEQNFEFF